MGAARPSIFTGPVTALTLSERPCRPIGQEGRSPRHDDLDGIVASAIDWERKLKGS
jgi:hypothetical protein